MASCVVDIYEKLRELALDPIADTLDVQHIELADPYLLGPDIFGSDTLNALVVSPLTPTTNYGDGTQHMKKIEQPYQVAVVFKRGDMALSDIVQRYATPLHDCLEQYELRRLGNLSLYNTAGKNIGHVVNFLVDEPDFFPPDNDDLYPGGLACFTIQVQVNYLKILDTDTLTGG